MQYSMKPEEIETTLQLIVQVCEKNTGDISKLIENSDKITSNLDKLTRSVDRLAQIQLAQSRDIARLTDYIARDDLGE